MQPGRKEEELNGCDCTNVRMETNVILDFEKRQCACSSPDELATLRRATANIGRLCSGSVTSLIEESSLPLTFLAGAHVQPPAPPSMRIQAPPLAALLAALALCCHSQALYPPPATTDIGVVLFWRSCFTFRWPYCHLGASG